MLSEEKMDELKQYKELVDSGIMTEEEFEAKKAAILEAEERPSEPAPEQIPVSPEEAPRYYSSQDFENKPVDSGSFGWAVLGFFIPLVGLILFLVWKNTKPMSAKKAGIGALVGFCLGMLGNIISMTMGAS